MIHAAIRRIRDQLPQWLRSSEQNGQFIGTFRYNRVQIAEIVVLSIHK
jgi:hypothetical protein